MIENIDKLQVGSLLFVGGHTPVSWLIRKVLDFKFSHVGIYIGCGKLLESDIWGVQITPMADYLNSHIYYGEIVNPPISEAQKSHMITTALSQLNHKYDYELIAGNALLNMHLIPKKWLTRFNGKNAWICSELVAYGLREAGVDFGDLLLDHINPKNLYALTKGAGT